MLGEKEITVFQIHERKTMMQENTEMLKSKMSYTFISGPIIDLYFALPREIVV